MSSGIFAEEILPIELRGTVVSVDDTVRPGVSLESLAKLKPVFLENGSTTAGNASGIGDGAALCIMTTRARAEKEGWDVVGKYVASAFVGSSLSSPSTTVTPINPKHSHVKVSNHGIWVLRQWLPSQRFCQ